MTTVRVDVFYCFNNELVTFARNVTLDMGDREFSNRNLNRAFETQHPRLFARIPTWTDNRGFHHRAGFECCHVVT